MGSHGSKRRPSGRSCPTGRRGAGVRVPPVRLRPARLVAALLEARGMDVPPPIQAALRRSADALTLQVRKGEPDPAYGDSDDGRAFVFDAQETEAPAVAATLACAVGHVGAAALAGRPDLPAALLFGAAGLERFASATGTPPPTDGVLPDARNRRAEAKRHPDDLRRRTARLPRHRRARSRRRARGDAYRTE